MRLSGERLPRIVCLCNYLYQRLLIKVRLVYNALDNRTVTDPQPRRRTPLSSNLQQEHPTLNSNKVPGIHS
jgi:hypothetical protein